MDINIPKEVRLYPEKRTKLEKQKAELLVQIQKSQNALTAIQQGLQRSIDEHNKILAKIELLDELENDEI